MSRGMPGDEAGAAIHPIGVAAERAGLTPELIRAWERRYGVVEPSRDEAGRRAYTAADIARLRLLVRATEGGRSIGQVAELGQEALEELVRQDEAARREMASPRESPRDVDAVIQSALERARALDGEGLETLLVRSASTYGVPVWLRSVLAPLFRAIGDQWHRGQLTPSQEHLASAVARTALTRLVAGLHVVPGAPVLLVATPRGERHEIGALLVAASATLEGWRVVYLGPDLPAEEIVSAAGSTGARAVALSAVYAPSPSELIDELGDVRSALAADVPLLVGGAAVSAAVSGNGSGIRALQDLDELTAELRALGG